METKQSKKRGVEIGENMQTYPDIEKKMTKKELVELCMKKCNEKDALENDIHRWRAQVQELTGHNRNLEARLKAASVDHENALIGHQMKLSQVGKQLEQLQMRCVDKLLGPDTSVNV